MFYFLCTDKLLAINGHLSAHKSHEKQINWELNYNQHLKP